MNFIVDQTFVVVGCVVLHYGVNCEKSTQTWVLQWKRIRGDIWTQCDFAQSKSDDQWSKTTFAQEEVLYLHLGPKHSQLPHGQNRSSHHHCKEQLKQNKIIRGKIFNWNRRINLKCCRFIFLAAMVKSVSNVGSQRSAWVCVHWAPPLSPWPLTLSRTEHSSPRLFEVLSYKNITKTHSDEQGLKWILDTFALVKALGLFEMIERSIPEQIWRMWWMESSYDTLVRWWTTTELLPGTTEKRTDQTWNRGVHHASSENANICKSPRICFRFKPSWRQTLID